MPMSDRDRFLWDLQGFLHLPGFLSSEHVDRLNQAIDAHRDRIVEHHKGAATPALEGPEPRRLLAGMLEWDHPWCDPFRELIAPAALAPYLNDILRPGWRMDQPPFCFLAHKGAEGLQFHGPGRVEIGDGFFHEVANGRMAAGMIVVEYILTDHGPGDGGFGVIPGSHKSNIACPQDILDWESDQDLFHQPVAKAGDVVLFNEACIHGTLPWTGPHERRVVLYRYSPKYMTLGGGLGTYTLPDWSAELRPEERAVMSPPTIVDPPVIDDEGRLQPPPFAYGLLGVVDDDAPTT